MQGNHHGAPRSGEPQGRAAQRELRGQRRSRWAATIRPPSSTSRCQEVRSAPDHRRPRSNWRHLPRTAHHPHHARLRARHGGGLPRRVVPQLHNPMAMLTMAMLQATPSRPSPVPQCSARARPASCSTSGSGPPDRKFQWKIAGINHQAWLLEITRDGLESLSRDSSAGGREECRRARQGRRQALDMVRFEFMRHFGYYDHREQRAQCRVHAVLDQESVPGTDREFNIPLDEYPRRCISQIRGWESMRETWSTSCPAARALKRIRRPHHGGSRDEPTGLHRWECLQSRRADFQPALARLRRGVRVSSTATASRAHGSETCPNSWPPSTATNINVQILAVQAALTRRESMFTMQPSSTRTRRPN